MHDYSGTHLIIIFLLFICIINLFILDLKVFSPISNIKVSDISIINPSAVPITTSPQLTTNNSQPTCPSSCLSIIKEATSSLSLSIGSPQTTTNTFQTSARTSSQIHETYIPLGTGSTSKSVWDDISGTDTMIDPANYGNIKEAYFIASLKNPTQNGQVEAQLYNVTDKHPVWGSPVVLNGPLSQTISSGKITLDNGSRLYRVQLKSTLGFAATLENAKIKIISE